jgi:hypothetical protein
MLPQGIFARILNFSVHLLAIIHRKKRLTRRRRTAEVIGRAHHMAFNT